MNYNSRNLRFETFQAYKHIEGSLCVYSHDAIINDFMHCLKMSTNKMEKRIARLEFCLKFLDNISDDVRAKGEAILLSSKEVMNDEFVMIEDPNLDDLLTYKKKMTRTFPTAGTVPFKEPINMAFHNHVKSVINESGSIYDIFTDIVTISFYKLKVIIELSSETTDVTRMLMDGAKLVFKGGAAIGKFTLSKPAILARMTDEEKEFLYSNFIKGGDNDTAVKFSNSSNFPSHILDAEIERLLKILMRLVWNHMEVYGVRQMISGELNKALNTEFEHKGEIFRFNNRFSKTFEIVEVGNDMSTIKYTSETSDRLFSTFSKLAFVSDSGLNTKFFLGRIKAAYTATMCEQSHNVASNGEKDDFSVVDFGNSISCYGEVLDISASCIDNELSFKEEFDVIQF